MSDVVIPKTLTIGGLEYEIVASPQVVKEMRADHLYGDACHLLNRIRLDVSAERTRISQTFIHEVLHAIDDVYLHAKLTEDETHGLAAGVSQALHQMGIVFVPERKAEL